MATLPTGYFVTHKLMLERTCYFHIGKPEGVRRDGKSLWEIVNWLKNVTSWVNRRTHGMDKLCYQGLSFSAACQIRQ